MQHWLLVRTRPGGLERHSSTRRPRVRAGDRALLYLAGRQVVFGVADVVSDPEEDLERTRWRWRFGIRPELAVDPLEAPPVQAAGVLTSSLGRHSYIRLTDEQFRAGRRAVAAAIVAAGYDTVADRFAAWQRGIRGSTRLDWVERLLAALPASPDVLELGVGAGVRSSRQLAERGRLTGVDVSAEQLARARGRLPGARLVQADLLELALPDGSFDAVVSLYVLNNLPYGELPGLLERVARWLRPGGLFLATLPAAENRGWQGEWLGVEMVFSGHEAPENERFLADSGLELVDSRLETIVEPEHGESTWHWVLARRPESSNSLLLG